MKRIWVQILIIIHHQRDVVSQEVQMEGRWAMILFDNLIFSEFCVFSPQDVLEDRNSDVEHEEQREREPSRAVKEAQVDAIVILYDRIIEKCQNRIAVHHAKQVRSALQRRSEDVRKVAEEADSESPKSEKERKTAQQKLHQNQR